MPDPPGLAVGAAIFGADAYTATAPPAATRPPKGQIRLAPVLVGAAVVYGAWRALR